MTDILRGLAEVSLAMSAVIALLLALTPLLRRRYAARWRYWAWLAVAVRLALPFNISLPSAPVRLEAPARQLVVYRYTPPAPPRGAPGAQPLNQPGQTGQISGATDAAEADALPTAAQPAVREVSLFDALPLFWAAGAALFLLWQAGSGMRFGRYVRRWGVPAGPEERAALDALKEELGIGGAVGLVICPGVGGPMLTGLFRPVILLPGETEHLPLILRHELTHLKRRDLWYKLLLLLVSALHWFNPLVWLMARSAANDLELVCDDDATVALGRAERDTYGRALLSALKQGRAGALSTGFRGGARAVAGRLKNLFAGPKKRGMAALTAAALAIAMGAGLVACNPQSKPPAQDDPEELFFARFEEAWTVIEHRTSLGCRDEGAEPAFVDESGQAWYRCEHYRSLSELHAAAAAIFYVGDAWKAELDGYQERDGALYLLPQNLNDGLPWSGIRPDNESTGLAGDTLTVVRGDETAIVYSIDHYYSSPGEFNTVRFSLVKEDGAWKFSNMYGELNTNGSPAWIDDYTMGHLLAKAYRGPAQAGDTFTYDVSPGQGHAALWSNGESWQVATNFPADHYSPDSHCGVGVLRYSAAAHAGGLGNLIFGAFDNDTYLPVSPEIVVRGDAGDLTLLWNSEASDLFLLPYTIRTTNQGYDTCGAGIVSFDGNALAQVTALPEAALRPYVTLPEGAEAMFDPAQNEDFWRDRKAVLSGGFLELFQRNPDYDRALPQVVPWVYEAAVPLAEYANTKNDVVMIAAARRYFDGLFASAGEFPRSSSEYPINSYSSQGSSYIDPTYPDATAYSVSLYDTDEGRHLERYLLFDGEMNYLGARSNLDFSLRFNDKRYYLGIGQRGLFGTPTATNYEPLSDGTMFYSEWFSGGNSCGYLYDPDTGEYRLVDMNTTRLNASTNHGTPIGIHIGSTVGELWEAYPELRSTTPGTNCITFYEGILGGGGCRMEFYYGGVEGTIAPAWEDIWNRTITRISLSAPTW